MIRVYLNQGPKNVEKVMSFPRSSYSIEGGYFIVEEPDTLETVAVFSPATPFRVEFEDDAPEVSPAAPPA